MAATKDWFRSKQEAIDSATYSVEWEQDGKTGQGYLYVSGQSGACIVRIPHDEPITRNSDAWGIACIAAREIGVEVGTVDHDKDTIHFSK